MTPLDLDQAVRKVLTEVTRETCLSSTARLVELGFGAQASFQMVCKCVEAKEEKTTARRSRRRKLKGDK